MKPWQGLVPELDEQLYNAAGFGQTSGIGRKPALVVIDTQYRTVGEFPKPRLEALCEYPTSCGELGWGAIPQIMKLLECFRDLGLPVIYAYVAPKGRRDGGRFSDKLPAITGIPLKGYVFIQEVAPREGDILIPKNHPSAFFGTPLASYLVDLGVDTVFLAGCTTSGCIRATVVDAFSFNYRVVVPQDAVFDRSTISHAISLFDIAAKYGDVLPTQEAIAKLSPQLAGHQNH